MKLKQIYSSTEVDALKEQQEKVMKALEESQANSEKQNEDSKQADDRLYALLPRVVADKMKSNQPVEPISYENVSVLMAEITTLNSITYVVVFCWFFFCESFFIAVFFFSAHIIIILNVDQRALPTKLLP